MRKVLSLISSAVALLGLILIFSSVSAQSLDFLEIDFGSPAATLPLDRFLKHKFTVKNKSKEAKTIEFNIRVLETNQQIVGWPQPQVLYLEPGEEKIVQTFLDEKWGKVERNATSDFQRKVEWTFSDKKTRAEKKETLVYKFNVLSGDKLTGDLKIKGKVVDEEGKGAENASVSISTGPGGWSTQTRTKSGGSFAFPGLPKRDDWVLEAAEGGQSESEQPPKQEPRQPEPREQSSSSSQEKCGPPPLPPCQSGTPSKPLASQKLGLKKAIAVVLPEKTDYTLVLKEPALKADYEISKTEKTEIGFWKGDVDENEKYLLLINGMENWKDQDLKSKSKLYLYTLDGELKWTYDMGWEGWGADLSKDGKYAAFITSNQTKTLGVLEAETGKPVWVKQAGEFKVANLPYPGPGGGIDSKEIKISNTNKYLGIGEGGGNVLLVELQTGKVLWTAFLKGQIRGITFDAQDKFVYAGSGDGNAYKLKIEDGAIVWKADIGSWPFVNSFKLSPDEKFLAAGGKVGEVTVIDTKSGKKLWQYDQQGAASWLDFSPDGKYLAAGGGGQGATTLYETETGKRIWRKSMFSHQGKFSADGQYILIGDQDLKIVDLDGGELADIMAEPDEGKSVGQGQYAYISKDGTKIIYTRRDIDPGATSIIFAKGKMTGTEKTVNKTAEKTLEKALEKAKKNYFGFIWLPVLVIILIGGIFLLRGKRRTR